MLIQNIGGIASGLTGDSASVPIASSGAQAAPVVLPQAAARTEAQPTPAQLKNAVDSINQVMKQSNSSVEFSIDQSSKRTVIKVVDSQSGELITQFPSKEALAISQMIGQGQRGALIKQNA